MRKRIQPKGKASYQIYIAGLNENGSLSDTCYYCKSPRLCTAHLRNKRGYVYLQWKDAGRVRSMYMGKAPEQSTTHVRQIQLGRAGLQARKGKARTAAKVRQGKLRRGRVSRG